MEIHKAVFTLLYHRSYLHDCRGVRQGHHLADVAELVGREGLRAVLATVAQGTSHVEAAVTDGFEFIDLAQHLLDLCLRTVYSRAYADSHRSNQG